MSNNEVTILDFGSQKLTILVGSRDVNNSINVKGIYAEDYEGFMDGEFISPKSVPKILSSLVKEIEKICGHKVDSLTIGVPTEFCYSECTSIRKSFGKPKKISQKDVDALKHSVTKTFKTHTLIGTHSIYYILGDNNKVYNPVGQVASRLSACLCLIFVDNKFLNIVSKALIWMGIDKFNFVCSAYAQAMYLFDEDMRDRYVLFVDCGYITTSVALVKGGGLLELSSFSLGSGHIAGDLSTLFKIPFNSALKLLRKIVLCIKPSVSDTYDLMIDGKITQIGMNVANAIVESRMEMIAHGIQKCFMSWKFEFPDFIPIILTGGGISFIKGGKDFLAKILGRNVELASIPYSQLNKQNFTSSMAVLNCALNMKKKR